MTRQVVTAEQFLTSTALERRKEDVQVPELGNGTVVPVWGLTPRERTEFEDRITRQPKNKKIMRERWVIECCRNDDGSKIFNQAQIEQLGQRDSVVVERLVDAALRLSGVTTSDLDKLVKNSESATED